MSINRTYPRRFVSRDALPGHDPAILPALRDLLSAKPVLATLDSHELAVALWVLGYLDYVPCEAGVVGALSALDIETGAA